MVGRDRLEIRKVTGVLFVVVTVLGGATMAFTSPAAAATVVTGRACGYYTNISLYGGPQSLRGCGQAPDAPTEASSPSVTLAPGGSDQPIRVDDPGGASAEYGRATVFGGRWPAGMASAPPSGPISVSAQATGGANAVSSSADIVPRTPSDPSSPGGFGPGPVEGDELHVECNASDSRVTGETTFKNAVLTGSTDVAGPMDQESIPDRPPVNYTRSGVLPGVGDAFTVVFNEQLANPDGSLTVNAVHIYLSGPTMAGEIVKGQATCGTTTASDVGAGSESAGSFLPATVSRAASHTGSARSPLASLTAATAAATGVKGSACGYYTNVGLFAGPQLLRGCGQPGDAPAGAASPSVDLPAGGSDSPITGANNGAAAQYGPAVIFGGQWPPDVQSAPPSGPISVSTQGTPGGGTVTSSADIVLNPSPPVVACEPNPTPPTPPPVPGQVCHAPGGFGPFPVAGDELHVTCSASASATTGSTTFKNALLATTTDASGNPKDQETVPDNPPVNYTRSGVITNVGDVFTVVYNQQIVNPDGSLTVNAAHVYLFGPTAVGDMVKGSVTCGTTPSPLTPTDTVAPGCSTLDVEPASPTDPTPKDPRTELIGVFDAGGLQSITNIQSNNAAVATGDPSGLPYLQLSPGQKGPLPMTATIVDSSKPMSWSFDATDVAGNVTHSSQCPTDSALQGNLTSATGAGSSASGGSSGGGSSGGSSSGGSSSGGSGAAGVLGKTGIEVLRLLLAAGGLIFAGSIFVRTTRRRRDA